ncbi:MAG: AAA family ATPase [Candidatus Lokiarchaeota archaeon]|nr:AAA family ATPase [Candidatus Lokiarchaeota archaeon]
MQTQRIKTGVFGLDELIEGGLPKDSITLVSGNSGTGKTTLSLQFLYNGIKQFEEPGIYIGLSENIHRISLAAERFHMNLEQFSRDDNLVFSDIPALEISEITKIVKSIDDKYKRLVIDPISALTFKYEADVTMREKIRELVELIREKEITAIITTELLENSNTISRFGEEFLSDVVIVLYYFREGARRFRGIEIRKARLTNHSEQIHLYKISSRNPLETGIPCGIQVFPNEKVFS